MKTATTPMRKTTNFSSENGRSFKGRLNTAKLGGFMQNLIKNYNNPELATLREWVANAWDSHQKAGQTRPIRVTLPTELSPQLVVEDWGTGMSYEEVRDIYAVFLTSTKDTENSEVGGFGIGGKSALALADQYTMVTVKNGLKNVFIFERSDEGGLDVLCAVNDEKTDLPNGVKVSVASNPEWAIQASSTFSSGSSDTISSVLRGWKAEEVELVNGEFESAYDDVIEFKNGILSKSILDSSKSGNAPFSYPSRTLSILVGPVYYQFTLRSNTTRGSEEDAALLAVQNLGINNFAIKIPIGDVTFPSSREVIEPSEDNFKVIKKALSNFVAEMKAHVADIVENFSNLEDAYRFATSPFSVTTGVPVIYKGRKLNKVKYSGIKMFSLETRDKQRDTIIKDSAPSKTEVEALASIVTTVIRVDENDANLSADTYRKYIRGYLLELQEELRAKKIAEEKVKLTDGARNWYGSPVHVQALITAEDDELHGVTSRVVSFSDLRKSKPVATKARQKPNNEELLRRANATYATTRRGGYYGYETYHHWKEHGGSNAIVLIGVGNHHAIGQTLSLLFNIGDRLLFTRTKKDSDIIIKGDPSALSLDGWLGTLSKKEIKEASEKIEKAYAVLRIARIDGSFLNGLKKLFQSNRANENLRKIFKEEDMALAITAPEAFSNVDGTNMSKTNYFALKNHFDDSLFIHRGFISPTQSIFSLCNRSFDAGNEEAVEYLNWSADRYVARNL